MKHIPQSYLTQRAREQYFYTPASITSSEVGAAVWGLLKQKPHRQGQWSIPGHLLDWLSLAKTFHSAHCMNPWPEKMDADCTVRTVTNFHRSFRIKYVFNSISGTSIV